MPRHVPAQRGRLFYRTECLKTTWTLKALLLTPFILLWFTRAFWASAIGESLVCAEQASESQAILIENLDQNYLVFERATALHQSSASPRVLVPVWAARESGTVNAVSKGIAELMARVARLPAIEMIPIVEEEPVTLNAARQVRDFLTREGITSVTVVAPALRSRRSLLVYGAVFVPAGVAIRCVPVFGLNTPASWTKTWHGMQEVGEQFFKLQYYRFWVLV